MHGRIILITGANTGLGLEIVRSLCKVASTYHIIVGGRSLEKAKAAITKLKVEQPDTVSTLEPLQIDVEDDVSITTAMSAVEEKFGRVDVLVNNAGASFDQDLHTGKIGLRDAWDRAWSVNTTGAVAVTSSFVPLLLKSSDPHLIFIASGTSTLTGHIAQKLPLDQPAGKGWPKTDLSWSSYRSAKAGMNMMMREWARLLKEDGVKVWAASPGLLATGLGGSQEALKKMGAVDPSIGGDFVRAIIEGERDTDVGKIVNRTGIQDW